MLDPKQPCVTLRPSVVVTSVCPWLQSELEDMIWEVDEDCDQCLTWNEFQAMYHRCNNDKTGKCTKQAAQHEVQLHAWKRSAAQRQGSAMTLAELVGQGQDRPAPVQHC